MKKYASVFLITLLIINFIPFKIKADSFYNACSTESVLSSNGNSYCMPESIYNNGTDRDKAVYRTMIRTGNIGSDDHAWFEQYILDKSNIRQQKAKGNLTWDSYFTLAKNYLTGVWNGNVGRINANTLNYWLGAMSGTYNTHSFQSDISSMQESGYKNYYTGSSTVNNNVVYNTGDTTYNQIFNKTTNQFYDITNNNYYTVNNYSYNFDTNYYTYNIDNNNYITTYNDFTSTNITIYTNNNPNKYSMFYMLPDGSNSYNMTLDQITGLRTDFNITNYSNYDLNNNVYSLYHFDNNLKNDSFSNTNNLIIKPGSINFVDGAINFGQALKIDHENFNIVLNDRSNQYSFRFFPGISKDFKLRVGTQYNVNYLETNINKVENIISTKETINGTNQNVIVFERSSVVSNRTNSSSPSISTVTYPSCPSGAESLGTSLIYQGSNKYELNGNSSNDYIHVYQAKRSCKLIESVVNSSEQIIINKTESMVYDNVSKHININAWNYLTIFYDNQKWNIYINNNLVGSYANTNLKPLSISVEQNGYFIIDELISFRQNTGIYSAPMLPYNSNIAYYLPESIETNNQILIKSMIPVNGWQIGGYRPVIPNKGFVYVYVDDFGFMKSLQQFDGLDWIDIDGALYNNVLNKWVSYKGFSIYLNNFEYQETQEFTIYSITDDFSFYQWLQQELNRIINAINSLNPEYNIIQNVTNNLPNSTNLWDFLIEFMNTLTNGIVDIADSLIEFIKVLFIPDSETIRNSFDMNIDDIKLHLGIIYLPFELFGTVVNSLINNLSVSRDPIIYIPEVRIMDNILIQAQEYNLNDTLNNENISNMHNIYLIVVDGILIIGFINLCRRKFNLIVGGNK